MVRVRDSHIWMNQIEVSVREWPLTQMKVVEEPESAEEEMKFDFNTSVFRNYKVLSENQMFEKDWNHS